MDIRKKEKYDAIKVKIDEFIIQRGKYPNIKEIEEIIAGFGENYHMFVYNFYKQFPDYKAIKEDIQNNARHNRKLQNFVEVFKLNPKMTITEIHDKYNDVYRLLVKYYRNKGQNKKGEKLRLFCKDFGISHEALLIETIIKGLKNEAGEVVLTTSMFGDTEKIKLTRSLYYLVGVTKGKQYAKNSEVKEYLESLGYTVLLINKM